MKLTEKSLEIYELIKAAGGRVSTDALVEATGRGIRSITPSVNDLVKKGLAVRDKVEVEGKDKPVTYVEFTQEGRDFVQGEE